MTIFTFLHLFYDNILIIENQMNIYFTIYKSN